MSRANAPEEGPAGEETDIGSGSVADAGTEGIVSGEDPGTGARPEHPLNLSRSIERLDSLLANAGDEEKIRAGMGIRLALGMAQELKDGLPLGTETAELVAGWVEGYGRDTVDAAVAIAREFLTKPEEMRKALGRNLGMGSTG